eukprot:CAMPEP_0113937788 /NCGR_PEP_ID=MMETSP1339-20121228/4329_1 /TAXON_ID=94617 /ORGANISM="Fibrocapsa japonica" /LENGTH=417 /DNA_ID=CAMNT_0000940687 /DNA_START=95 /DNA_END=1348 /DNA_ORIENTATION=- /assembly_acc=CAM_ASM_000762
MDNERIKKELEEARKQLQIAQKELSEKQKESSKLTKNTKPVAGGILRVIVNKLRGLTAADGAPNDFDSARFTLTLDNRPPVEVRKGQLQELKEVDSLDFRLGIEVVHPPTLGGPRRAVLEGRAMLREQGGASNTHVVNWLDLKAVGPPPDLAVGTSVECDYGQGEVVAIREEDGVCQVALSDWRLAQNAIPMVYCQPSSLRAVAPSPPPALGDLEDEAAAGGQKKGVAAAGLAVGSAVQTDYGRGTVVAIRESDGMHQVAFSDWRLANDGVPHVYLQAGALQADPSGSKDASAAAPAENGEPPGVLLMTKYSSPTSPEVLRLQLDKKALADKISEIKEKIRSLESSKKKGGKKAAAPGVEGALGEAGEGDQKEEQKKTGWLAKNGKIALACFWVAKNPLLFIAGVTIMHLFGDELAV